MKTKWLNDTSWQKNLAIVNEGFPTISAANKGAESLLAIHVKQYEKSSDVNNYCV